MLALLASVHDKQNEMHDAARQKSRQSDSSHDANDLRLSLDTISIQKISLAKTVRLGRSFSRAQ